MIKTTPRKQDSEWRPPGRGSGTHMNMMDNFQSTGRTKACKKIIIKSNKQTKNT